MYVSPHGERIIGESNSDGWVMLVGLCQSQADLIIHKNGYVTMVTMVVGFLLPMVTSGYFGNLQ